MKKFFAGLIVGAMMSTGIVVMANEIKEWIAYKATFDVYVNGQKFENELPTVAIEGRTYLPLKAIGDVLGVSVQWNEAKRRVEVTRDGAEAIPSPNPNFDGLKVNITSVTGKKGDTLEVPVNLEGVPAEGINNFDFSLKFDSTAISIVGMEYGNIVMDPEENFEFQIDPQGRISFLFLDQDQEGKKLIKTSGLLMKLKVKIKDTAKVGPTYIFKASDKKSTFSKFDFKDIPNFINTGTITVQ